MKRVLVLLVMILLCWPSAAVYGADTDLSVDSDLADYDFSDIQKVIDSALSTDSVNFVDLLKAMIQGKISDLPGMLKEFLWDKVLLEVDGNRGAIAQILMIAVVGAIFTNFSSIFSKSQISETGFYITYLLLITILAAAFALAGNIARDVIQLFLNFMKALMPSYFLAAAFAGGSVTSIAFYEFTLLLVSVVQWVLLNALIPIVNIYLMLMLINHISKDSFLSKLLDLLKTIIDWSLKSLLGIVLGYNVIQSMILPYADAVKSSAIGKAIQVIPGIGQGANAVTDTILGIGVLVKNGIGTAALVILIIIAAIPLLKLVVITILYQGAAAAVQPISDKRIIACIESMAVGAKMLIKIVFTALLLFLITIAMICTSTNVNYFSR